MKRLSIFLVILSVFISGRQNKPHISESEGIRRIQNADAPVHGTVLVEVEKRREINPFENPEIDLEYLDSARLEDGRVVFFDGAKAKAYLFSAQNKLIKDMVRNGQGPGEFGPMQAMQVFVQGDRIWITNGNKLARFDGQGVFTEEFQTGDRALDFIDRDSYLTKIDARAVAGGVAHSQILKKMLGEKGAVVPGCVFKEGDYRLTISNPKGRGGFADVLCQPGLVCSVDPRLGRVYVLEKSGYTIEAFQKDGQKLFLSESPFRRYKISRKEVEAMFPSMAKSPQLSWIIEEYPDRLMAVERMISLPNGYFAVYRIVGPRKYQIDVFDREGVWQYIFKWPACMVPRNECFHSFGFSNIEEKGDEFAYVEYTVKNVPEVFKN